MSEQMNFQITAQNNASRAIKDVSRDLGGLKGASQRAGMGIKVAFAAAGIAIDWPDLLKDISRWPDPQRRVQVRWAREYWSASEASKKGESKHNRKKKPAEDSSLA